MTQSTQRRRSLLPAHQQGAKQPQRCEGGNQRRRRPEPWPRRPDGTGRNRIRNDDKDAKDDTDSTDSPNDWKNDPEASTPTRGTRPTRPRGQGDDDVTCVPCELIALSPCVVRAHPVLSLLSPALGRVCLTCLAYLACVARPACLGCTARPGSSDSYGSHGLSGSSGWYGCHNRAS